MVVAPLKRRFTTAEYESMVDAGILTEDDRVELIEGEIYQMTPIGSPHAACVNRLTHLLSLGAGGRAIVAVQNPARLDDFSMPQPDLALLRPRADFYAAGHPRPEDVLVLVEVADSTLAFDRNVKLPLYARCGVPEVWIVDVGGSAIEVHRHPTAGAYADSLRLTAGDRLAPESLPDLDLAAADILG